MKTKKMKKNKKKTKKTMEFVLNKNSIWKWKT